MSSHEDTITQLQTCLDQLATQFYASLRYTTTHHPLSAPSKYSNHVIEGYNPPNPKSSLPPSGSGAPSSGPSQTQLSQPQSSEQLLPATPAAPATPLPSAPPEPVSPTHLSTAPLEFSANLKELAHDLILKQRQIEYLIRKLPSDLEGDEAKQEAKMRELKVELDEVDREREEIGKVKDECLRRVEDVILGFRRVV